MGLLNIFAPGLSNYLNPQQQSDATSLGLINAGLGMIDASANRPGVNPGFASILGKGIAGYGAGVGEYQNDYLTNMPKYQAMQQESDLANWYKQNPQIAAQMGIPQGAPVTPDLLSSFFTAKAKTEAGRTPEEIALKKAQTAAYAALANQRANPTSGTTAVKPLPSAALKLQQENLDAIGTANSINADLGAFIDKINNKQLDLGLTSNAANRVKNYLGVGDEKSAEYSSFKSTLEKMRNDSLRLNKGVQTEGDAVRAWNELFESMNDPKVVSKRLEEIRNINQRAATLRENDNEILRSNYNQQPMDYSPYRNVKTAIKNAASGAEPKSNGGWTVKKVGQ